MRFYSLSSLFVTHTDFPLQISIEGIVILTFRTCWLTSYISELASNIPIPLSTLAGQDLSELEEKAKAAADALKKEAEDIKGDTSVVNADTKSAPEGDEKIAEDKATEAEHEDNHAGEPEGKSEADSKKGKAALPGYVGQRKGKMYAVPGGHSDDDDDDDDGDDDDGGGSDDDDESVDSSEDGNGGDLKPPTSDNGGDKKDRGGDRDREEQEGDLVRLICLGLRVYTKKDAPAVVGGQLRHEMGLSFDGLAIQA